MAKSRYITWGHTAIFFGAALTAIEVLGAVSYLRDQVAPSYLVVGGAVVTVVAAILPILAARCWRGRRRLLAVLLWAAMVPACSLIFTAAVERTGGARDEANRGRQEVAQRIELARAAVKDAKAVADADESAAKAECASGRKAKCLGLEARADASRQRLDAARTKLAQAGVVPTDPQARRIAAVLPWVSEEAVQLYQPLVLPLSISALALLLTTVGAHQPAPEPIKRPKARNKQKKRAPRKPAHQNGVTDWVAAYTAKHGKPPKVADVRQAFGVSKTTAWRRLRSAS
jgi:hypothetical protein